MGFNWKSATRVTLMLVGLLIFMTGVALSITAVFSKSWQFFLLGIGIVMVVIYVMVGFSDNGDYK